MKRYPGSLTKIIYTGKIEKGEIMKVRRKWIIGALFLTSFSSYALDLKNIKIQINQAVNPIVKSVTSFILKYLRYSWIQ